MRLNVFLLSMFLVLLSTAQNKKDSATIFKVLATPDSVTGAVVKVYNSYGIEESMADRSSRHVVKTGTGQGFRIQVFSSNVHRTAKTEAFNIEKELVTAFPETGIYVSYTSPFWKVRVGDFKTAAEARSFSEELINAFPQLKATTYIVKDKVNY